MKDEGIIELSGHRKINIVDKEKLREILKLEK